MAVQRRQNWVSQMRVDVPQMRSIESAASNDWDQYVQAFITDTTQGYFIRGFNILMAGAIGGASSNLQLEVDPGAIMHINASQSGTMLMVPVGTSAQQLNAALNTNVVGAFSPSSLNYVTLDYIRFLDSTTDAQIYLWDPTTDDETTINAPQGQILTYQINISTVSPTSNLLPIAVVLTDAGNNVLQVTDARWLAFRLGTGGPTPNPFYVYPWPEGRTENPSSSSSDSLDPFSGGDKGILCLKDWMNAVMSVLLEIKGTTYWYSVSSSGSLESLREDLGNTVITGSGNISNGIIPNAQPILTTTGNIVSGSNQLTALGSTAGLADGQYIIGTGIPTGSIITNISGSTVTMSEEATLTISSNTVSFYDPSVITAPGQINWDEPINITVIGSALNYVIASNYNSTDISLSNDEAAYITLVRDASITPNLIFTNGVQQVVSVGSVAWTSGLLAGDYLKLASDTHAGYYLIQSVDSSIQVTLSIPFAETSTGAAGAQAVYAFGSYTHSPSPSTNRDIYISSRETVPAGQNVFWLFLREDNGGNPTVYIRFLGAELSNGESRAISGVTSAQLLLYIGSPSDSASAPQYVSALNPGSVPEITLLNFGTFAQTNPNSYFLINSSGNSRQYYVWFNQNGGGTDPAPGGTTNASIEVPITTGMTAAQIAAAVALALESDSNNDFSAIQSSNQVTVTNTSAGACSAASTGTMISPFSVTINQVGTGIGNNFIHDGDNLTLAIKELDVAIGQFFSLVDEPCYDETIDIVASGGTYPGSLNPPVSINGPISSTTILPLPNNSRLGDIAQRYTVGRGYLQIYLNGQYLRLGQDWLEVGSAGSLSSTWETLIPLVVGDSLEFRIQSVGGSGGEGGGIGPEGPAGPQGPPGVDEAGGPIAVSTKTSDYSVMLSDNFLLANCVSNPITFTLPTASSAVGRIFYFKKVDSTSNAMTIMTTGGQLIDGSTTLSTTVQYEEFSMVCDGTSFWIF